MSFVLDACDSVAVHCSGASFSRLESATGFFSASCSSRNCSPSCAWFTSILQTLSIQAQIVSFDTPTSRATSSAGLRLLQRPDHLPFRVAGLPLAFVRNRTQLGPKTRVWSTSNRLAKRGPG
jgi:hypothetical protein